MRGHEAQGALAIDGTSPVHPFSSDDGGGIRTTRRKQVRAQDLAQCPRASVVRGIAGHAVAESQVPGVSAATAAWASDLAEAERARDDVPASPWGGPIDR
jgi:hypothetical protein